MCSLLNYYIIFYLPTALHLPECRLQHYLRIVIIVLILAHQIRIPFQPDLQRECPDWISFVPPLPVASSSIFHLITSWLINKNNINSIAIIVITKSTLIITHLIHLWAVHLQFWLRVVPLHRRRQSSVAQSILFLWPFKCWPSSCPTQTFCLCLFLFWLFFKKNFPFDLILLLLSLLLFWFAPTAHLVCPSVHCFTASLLQYHIFPPWTEYLTDKSTPALRRRKYTFGYPGLTYPPLIQEWLPSNISAITSNHCLLAVFQGPIPCGCSFALQCSYCWSLAFPLHTFLSYQITWFFFWAHSAVFADILRWIGRLLCQETGLMNHLIVTRTHVTVVTPLHPPTLSTRT